MLPTRQNRFSTSPSLRRLRTAFSSTISRSTSPDSTTSASTHSSSSAASLRDMLSLRRRPSDLEFEMEEEAHLFSAELGVLEPRPSMGWTAGSSAKDGGHVVVGIFEVLERSC